jgi:hypothetical protein
MAKSLPWPATASLIALASASGEALAEATGLAPERSDPLVEIVGYLAWPAAALLMVLMLRRPIAALVGAIGGRITKLSVFKVELELLPVERATAPLLDELRDVAKETPLGDSSGALLKQVAGEPAEYAVVDLGAGDEWLTSRLYIAAVTLPRMRGVRAFVFVETADGVQRSYVGMVAADRLRWRLAMDFPWLEGAWLQASASLIPDLQAPPLPAPAARQPVIVSDTGALDPDKARNIVTGFITSLQRANQLADPQWVKLGGGRAEHAQWVTGSMIRSLAPQECSDGWAPLLRDASRAQQTRAVLRRRGALVALVHPDMRFARLVDRAALLEQMAANLADEPDVR